MLDPTPSQPGPAPVLAYLVTEDWYFVSHRLPMARAAQAAGFQVHVLTNVTKHGQIIEDLGFTLHPLPWKRGRAKPLAKLALMAQVRRLYRALKPAIVHHVAAEAVVVGSLAALGMRMGRVNAFTGLGFPFVSTSRLGAAARGVMLGLFRALLGAPNSVVLVQNPDDRDLVHTLGVAPETICLIPGSGVDTDTMPVLPEPQGPVTMAFVGRLLAYKGVRNVVAAQQALHKRGVAVRLLIAGTPDPANPTSVSTEEIEAWKALPGVQVLGHVTDIRRVWAEAHVAVLPSRREGVPKSLLEAAAYGRPLIAADAPGCREITRTDVSGILVPPDDEAALTAAIERLAADADLRRRLGAGARKLVEDEFSSARVVADTAALYRRLAAVEA